MIYSLLGSSTLFNLLLYFLPIIFNSQNNFFPKVSHWYFNYMLLNTLDQKPNLLAQDIKKKKGINFVTENSRYMVASGKVGSRGLKVCCLSTVSGFAHFCMVSILSWLSPQGKMAIDNQDSPLQSNNQEEFFLIPYLIGPIESGTYF